MKKIEEVEVATYWKIKDYEELLKQRPTKSSVEDFIKESEVETRKNYIAHTQA
jgi:hypothetical protein